jgi:hypothetical protein
MGAPHDEVIRWFSDSGEGFAHYSLHRVCYIGLYVFNRDIGQWFEPSLMARIFQVCVCCCVMLRV